MKKRLHLTNQSFINFIGKTLSIVLVTIMFSSCQKEDIASPVSPQKTGEENSLKAGKPNRDTGSIGGGTGTVPGVWERVFTDEFNDLDSFDNWERTERFDYNSDLCQYLAAIPTVDTYDGKNCLVLTATKNGSIWNSGHVKSIYEMKPGNNSEFRTSAYIKLTAVDGGNYVDFSSTYGAWPAFWTVQENRWPVNGEIDIFEAYTYGNYTRWASNMFYGTRGRNKLGTSMERHWDNSEGWHQYDQYWANVNGNVTVRIELDGEVVASYSNADHPDLELENFGPHNIIFNMNVGDNYGIFDNSQINIFDKAMMWVDYVTVDWRPL